IYLLRSYRITCHSLRFLIFLFTSRCHHRTLHSFPTRRSSDLAIGSLKKGSAMVKAVAAPMVTRGVGAITRHPVLSAAGAALKTRSEEHTSELQSRVDLVCRLLLEKKKQNKPCTNVGYEPENSY